MREPSSRGRRVLGAAFGAAVAAVLFAHPSAAQRPRHERIYVTVVDSRGKPVTGLTTDDFSVKENGAIKEIIKAGPATEPMSLQLLTDGLGQDPTFTGQDLRTVLGSIVHAVRAANPDSLIGLMRFDGAAVQQVKFSQGTADLDNAIRRLFTNNSVPVLLEAIDDSCRSLEKLPNDRRLILAIVGGYKPDQSSIASMDVATRLRQSRVGFWALEGRSVAGPSPVNPNRDAILRLATHLSGGFHDTVSAGTALAGAAQRLTDLILSQYSITYGPPDGLATGKLEVGVKRAGVNILAPSWTPSSR